MPGGFALTLAGECPLFSAWGRFEDGAPAPHEHLHSRMVSYSSSPGIEGGLYRNGFALTLAGECPLCGAGAP